jgi:nitrite reductase/ring-hydroxylating ferredoxin subunit
VASVSKIRFFLISAAFVLIFSSCNKKNDVIPDVYVNFTLDLYDFVNLSAMGSSDTVNAYDVRIDNGREYAGGYDGNGIIVYTGVDEFYAYDRTCPHDYEVNGLSIKVKIDSNSSIYAVCPKCGTTYALSANGTPASGIGQYPLKNYKTSFDGRYVRVWN